MLRDEIAKYTELSGNDGEHTPIGIIGAYLDGYEKGLNDRETHADIIKDNYMTREEAQNWLWKLYARADITDEYGDMEDMQPYEEAINMAISALSTDVRENIRGTWEEWKGSRYQGMPFCSNCGMAFPFYAKDYNFCPNCGEDKRKPTIDEEDIPMEYFESGGK